MPDAKHERMRARERLEQIAPALDDASAYHFERLVATILDEVARRGMKDDNELLADAIEAIAGKYYVERVRSDH